MARPVVAIVGTRYQDFAIEEEILGPLADVRAGPGGSAAEILAVAGDASVVLAGAAPRFDEALLAELDAVAVVRYGIGVDSIDAEAARRLGTWVVNVPDYGTDAVALHAVTLALAGIRRLVAADAAMRAGEWGFAPLRPLHLPAALTAGVVGFGRIGQRVAAHLAALGFGAILAHDPLSGVAVPGVTAAPLDELVAASDVISLHLPGSADGRPLFDAELLARCKPGSVVVNTARGSLIDDAALAEALGRGAPAVAALDVFSPEPADLAPFAGVLDRMILTPHMAWYTDESERDLRVKAATEARRILEGEEPRHAVVRPDRAEEPA